MLRSDGTAFCFIFIHFPRIKIRGYNMNHPYRIYLLAAQSRRLDSYCRDGIYSIHKEYN